MRTINIVSILFIITLCYNCDTDDDKDNNPPGNLSLQLTQQTNVSELESFEGNAMTQFNGHLWLSGGQVQSNTHFSDQVYKSVDGVVWFEVVTTGLTVERYRPSLTAFNNTMWLIGGLNTGLTPLPDVLQTTDGETWTTAVASAPFGGTAYHHTFVHNGKLFLVTGFQSGTPTHNSVWSTVDGENWTEENAQALPYHYASSFVKFQNEFYIIGGYNESTGLTNKIWKSANGINWSEVATSGTIFRKRAYHSTTEMNGKVYLMGGEINGGLEPSADLWYTNDMVHWQQYNNLPTDARAIKNHNTLNYNGTIWLFGGVSYDDDTHLWEQESKILTIEAL